MSRLDDGNEDQSLRAVPAVGRVLTHPEVRALHLDRDLTLRLVREAVAQERARLRTTPTVQPVDFDAFCSSVVQRALRLLRPSLERVLNATGIVLHTNLGRAPLSRSAAEHVATVAQGYSNLEFDLAAGCRGSRQSHVREILCWLTGAEDALVVNNNAAALLLVLSALAPKREVVLSRGELIEIGDSFRLPDILKASGARLVEVGTTNRTRLSDYQRALSAKTALLFKAHTSNFKTIGFTESVAMTEIAALARDRGLVSLFDIGSGLLRKPPALPFPEEPSAEEALEAGADLVTFSGDKLLGAAQAGIIVGRRDLLRTLAAAPLLRALRPGRLTLAALEAVAREHLDSARRVTENPVLEMLTRTDDLLQRDARQLATLLCERGVQTDLVTSQGQVGGGAVPGSSLPGWAVRVLLPRGGTAAALHARLLRGHPPVVGVLREGDLLLDVRTLQEGDLALVADATQRAFRSEPTAQTSSCRSGP